MTDSLTDALPREIARVSTPRQQAAQRALGEIAALQARAERAEAALRAAQQLRKAADPVSEWFCNHASHLEGPRIQALRMAMMRYDAALAALKSGDA